jgi:UDP-glucose 4-epimerase
MKTILVTGAYGFIGTYLTEELQKTFRVIPVSRTKHNQHDVVFDLTRPGTVKLPQADAVIHLAALTRKSTDDKTPDFDTQNIRGTKHLLKLLSSSSLTYFLYVSTADVYGSGNAVPIDESKQPHPETAYAKSKYAGEQIVTSWCDKHHVPFAIARLGNIYGPGDEKYHKSVPVFIRQALSGKPVTIHGDGKTRKTYMYAGDAARALALLMRKKQTGIINIIDGKPVTLTALARMINTMTGNKAGISYTKGAAPDTVLSDSLLRKTGFAPRPIGYGLKKTIDWYTSRQQVTVLFDLDGTLVDHRKRMYLPYLIYYKKHGLKPLPITTYIGIKRRGLSETGVVGSDIKPGDLKKYLNWKQSVIESPDLLMLDMLQPGVKTVLQTVSKKHACFVVTIRSSNSITRKELKRLGILRYFRDVITVKRGETKTDEVARAVKRYHLDPGRTVMIGDSEQDVTAARSNGVHSVSVTTGLRGITFLKALDTIVIPSMDKLPDALQALFP